VKTGWWRNPNGRSTSKAANWDAAKKSLDVVQKRVNLRPENGIKAVSRKTLQSPVRMLKQG
jgi:hypothetical protein